MNRKTRKALAIFSVAVCTFICVGGIRSLFSQSQSQTNNTLSGWRPNGDTRGVHYVGNKVCVRCHLAQASQLATPMAQALQPAPDWKALGAGGRVMFRLNTIGLEQLGNPGSDPLCFSSPEGLMYYMPALIRLTLDTIDNPREFYLDQMLFHLIKDGPGNSLVIACDEGQRRFIATF